MACPQGRDMVTEAGRSPRDVGRPLHEVAHPPGGAEGVSTPELSGRLYQLSIGLFYWFFGPLLNLGLICLCLAFIAAQILRAERLDPTDERAVAEFALSAIQRHGYGEGQAVPSPRVSPEEQVMKTCCLCVNYVCIWLMFWFFVAKGRGHIGRDVGWGAPGLSQLAPPPARWGWSFRRGWPPGPRPTGLLKLVNWWVKTKTFYFLFICKIKSF